MNAAVCFPRAWLLAGRPKSGRTVRSKMLGLVAVALLAGSLEVRALPVAAWDAGDTVALCSGFTCGMRFTAVTDLTVLALGAFNGAFETEATVGIWNSVGALLRSVTISAADSLV